VSLPLHLDPEAETDVAAAAAWYDAQREGLGSEFMGELRRLLNLIEVTPETFPVVLQDIRRALLRRFPYEVFFVIDSSRVTVIACIHGHRHPDTWQGRR
jgi:plasmid stabilization system protein ParE